MGIRIRSWLSASLLGCALVVPVAPASAGVMVIDLLRENFNDVSGIPAGGERTVADILLNTPSELPAGTTANGSVNVRGEDNTINTSGGNNGFHDHFTSNFLVLGDDTGQIGGTPNTDNSVIRIPFVIPGNALIIAISYRDAFNGTDSNPNQVDEFIVRVNSPGPGSDEVELLQSPFDFGGHTGIAAVFAVGNDGDPDTVGVGTYNLVFRLNEGGANTNTAAGIDRIRVRALIVPEPATWALVLSGLLGLAAWSRRRPARQRARR